MTDLPSPILCRPAALADTTEALALVRDIWDGEDYLPEVWGTWIADLEGILAVAEWHGRLAGLGHLADLGAGETWLEGLRVAPELQGQGIGTRLHDYFVARWLERDSPVIRLLTNEHREAVKSMCARTGFVAVARVRFRMGQAATGSHAFEPAADSRSTARILAKEGTSQLCSGLIDLGWELADATPTRLEQTPGLRLWSWRAGRGWLATRRDPANPDPEITICAAAGNQLPEFFSDVRALAHDLGVQEIHWLAPDSAPLLHALEEAGFDMGDSEEPFLAFERRR
jgi:GNAT superfamily N-acetyltransferase